jgi:hypothetical protein
MITNNASKKSSKRSALESRSTLDAIHNAQVASYINNEKDVENITTQLEVVNGKINKIENDVNNISIQQSDIVLLKREREQLLNRLKQLENKDDLMNYYLRTGNIVFDYYNVQEKISAGTAKSVNTKARTGTIFAALEAASDEVYENVGIIDSSVSGMVPLTLPQEEQGFDREKLLNKYLNIVDPEIARSVINEIEDNWSECQNCGKDMIFNMNEAYISCPSCGYQDFVLIDSDKPSYKDPPREISYYAYKRINHFNEWLAQFQAKESTEIPQEIFDGILMELKKERITNMASLKLSKLREILRKLKYNKYYEHIPHILNRLNGQNAPVMSRDNEEKLRHMFREIQPSFQKHCPSERSNFLSYSYVLYKFCELLELDDFLPSFPLLKNRDKLYMQDKIWQKICSDLKWEFIRTI